MGRKSTGACTIRMSQPFVHPACTRGPGAQGCGNVLLWGVGGVAIFSYGNMLFGFFHVFFISFNFLSLPFIFFHLPSFPFCSVKEFEPKSKRKFLKYDFSFRPARMHAGRRGAGAWRFCSTGRWGVAFFVYGNILFV